MISTRHFRCVATAAALLLALPAFAAPPPSACRLQSAELPVISTEGQPVVDVKLDGESHPLLADTGAFSSFLWSEVLPTLKLRTGNSIGYAGGVGGITAIHEITIARMNIGGAELRNQNFLVVGSPGGRLGQDAGLLGADFLGQFDVQFDLPGKMIRLIKPTHCKGEEEVFWSGPFSEAPIVSEAESPRFLVNVKINGRSVPALIDTGAARSVIVTGAAQKLGVQVNAMDEKSYGIGPGVLATGTGRIKSFSLGDETIRNTTIRVADVFKAATSAETGTRLGEFRESPDMILGADFFRSHKVLLSRSQNRMYFSYTGGPVFDVTRGPLTASPSPASAPAS